MADLCLTVDTDTNGGYWTGHPTATSCTGERRIGQSCTGNVLAGTLVQIAAYPDSNYRVGGWDVQSSTGASVNYTISGTSVKTLSFTYLESYGDVDVIVSFASVVCQLTIQVGSGSGQIRLDAPSKLYPETSSSKVFSIDPLSGDGTNIVVSATPSTGYSITGWNLDGAAYNVSNPTSPTPNSFSIAGYSSRVITVYFETEVACTPEYQLTVSISGQGTVTSQNKLYCDGDILNISPIPANGWTFDKWDHDGSLGISELAGNVLRVVMDTDRTNITAIFKQGQVTNVESTFFYCSSDNYKNNIVSFDFVNTSENPSVSGNYHFRVNFYNDINKTKLVYSAFSLADNKRWFLDDGYFSQLSANGLDVMQNETVRIIYDPEVLPQQITETQKFYLINNESLIYEKPLICGVKYYVEIQSYETTTNYMHDVKTISLMLDCNRVDSYYWNYNKDKNNWLCSGQGKTDLKVSKGIGQSINPSIDSNIEGTFKIVWQGRRIYNGIMSNNVYSAVWDSMRDILYSSGQGLYDALEMDEGNHPIVVTDPALNFYITGITENNIKYKECAVSIDSGDSEGVIPGGSTFEAFCYPGSSSFLGSSYDEIKMRVYKEDTSGSLVVNSDKVVSVINKTSIKLDVEGIVGAYAVRVRNMEDPEWGDWINIDNKLYDDATEGDAYRIDNNRFLVSWNIKKYNGLRRVCCQVLTMYGISNTFCIEVLANFEVPQHVFKFYTNSDRTKEFPKYNGQYVLSLNAEGVTSADGKATVYFDAEFSEPISTTGIRYNLVQQGINDKRSQEFKTITSTKLSGEFEINKNDGIFNKDGVSFIEIIFSESGSSEFCGSDTTDDYNYLNSDIEEIKNIDLLPEEVYEKYQRDRLSKAIDINEFKQNYDKDDINFKFGNPGYYRK